MNKIDLKILDKYSLLESDFNEITSIKSELFSDIGKEVIDNWLKNKNFEEIITGLFILEKSDNLKKWNLNKVIKKIYLFDNIEEKLSYLVENFNFIDVYSSLIYISIKKSQNYFKKLNFNFDFLNKNDLWDKKFFINFIDKIINNWFDNDFLLKFLDENNFINLNYIKFILKNKTSFDLVEYNNKINFYHFLISYQNPYYFNQENFIFLKLESVLEFSLLKDDGLDLILLKFIKSLKWIDNEKIKAFVNEFFQSYTMEKDKIKREKLTKSIIWFNNLELDVNLLSELPSQILFNGWSKRVGWKEDIIEDLWFKGNYKLFIDTKIDNKSLTFYSSKNRLVSFWKLKDSFFIIISKKSKKNKNVLNFDLSKVNIDDNFYSKEIKPVISDFVNDILVKDKWKYYEVTHNSYFFKS